MKSISDLARASSDRSDLQFLLAAVSLVVGLSPLLMVPLVGDDPLVMAEGLGPLQSGEGFDSYMSWSVSNLVSGGHVLPIGGIVTAIQVGLTNLVASSFLVSPSLIWAGLRIVWILVAIAALTWALTEMLSSKPKRIAVIERKKLAAQVFAWLSFFVLVTLQIHGVWSQDPVLSYSLASWLTPTLVFIWWGFLFRAVRPGEPRKAALLMLVLVGVVGILTYEMFIAGVISGAIGIAVLLAREKCLASHQSVAVLVVSVGLLAIFAGIQFWRMSQPNDYLGTSTGFAAMLLPVLFNGLMGTLPLTNVPLTMGLTPDSGIHAGNMILVGVGVGGALLSGLLAANNKVSVSKSRRLTVILSLVSLTVTSVGIFAASAKYQMEIGQQLGRTYLFYATGALVLAALFSLLAIWVSSKSMRLVAIVGIALIPVALIQWHFNSRSLVLLADTQHWSSALVDSLVLPVPAVFRCDLVNKIQDPGVARFIREGLLVEANAVYQFKFGSAYCPAIDHGDY